MRYAQIVLGPAGCGKSTYCATMQRHAADNDKVIQIVNMDPAAEYFEYNPMVDVRELIQVDDAMEDPELKFGPNGALIFCMEYLVENCKWLEEQLGDDDDDYIIFDFPGQLELYTHMTVIGKLIEFLQTLNFRICAIFVMDTQFMTDAAKFLSGTMAALSVMINLELPHMNILTKLDLLSKSARKQLDKFLEPDSESLLADMEDDPWNVRYGKLTSTLGKLIEGYGIVRFFPLNIKDEENIADIKITIDNMIQYGEDADVKMQDFEGNDDDDGD